MNRRNWIFHMTGLLAASALPFGAGGATASFPKMGESSATSPRRRNAMATPPV